MFQKFEVNEAPIAYQPIYSKITGSVNAGILLTQLVYWYNIMEGKEFYKTNKQFELETGLGIWKVKGAKDLLIKKKLIEVKLRGVPRKSYFSVNTQTLNKLLEECKINQLKLQNQPTEVAKPTNCRGKTDQQAEENQPTNKIKKGLPEINTDTLCPGIKLHLSFSPFDFVFAKRLFQEAAGITPSMVAGKNKPPDLKKWAFQILKIREKFGKSIKDLNEAYDWVLAQPTRGTFSWKSVIRSPSKLKEKWLDIEAQRGVLINRKKWETVASRSLSALENFKPNGNNYDRTGI